MIWTFLSIWWIMISTCLSLIATPVARYTFWTSSNIYFWTALTPVTLNNSLGWIEPLWSFWPATTTSPFLMRSCAFGSSKYFLSFDSWPPCEFSLIVTVIPVWRDSIRSTLPPISAIIAWPFGLRASNNSWIRGKPAVISLAEATPPVWKVRIVNWVPGSPIDWAATTPTASPTSTDLLVARFLP